MKIAVLPGDGIGREIVAEAVKVLKALGERLEFEFAEVGGAAYDAHGHPLPDSTLKLAQAADAVLFGAVGDWKYDALERALRPEQAILGLRKHLGLFANLRPAICHARQHQHATRLGRHCRAARRPVWLELVPQAQSGERRQVQGHGRRHALAYATRLAPTLPKEKILLVNLSGRGDKDLHIVAEAGGLEFFCRASCRDATLAFRKNA